MLCQTQFSFFRLELRSLLPHRNTFDLLFFYLLFIEISFLGMFDIESDNLIKYSSLIWTHKCHNVVFNSGILSGCFPGTLLFMRFQAFLIGLRSGKMSVISVYVFLFKPLLHILCLMSWSTIRLTWRQLWIGPKGSRWCSSTL